MKRIDARVVVVAIAISLTACVAPPLGPTIPASPGPNRSFDAFAADQAVCQQYAASQTAPAAYAANNQAVGGTILSTALGAGLGAAIGGGRGAAIGAASGAALGTVAGASGSGFAQMSLQQQYDVMYAQCMSAHGDTVPGFSPAPGAPPYGAPGRPPYGGPPAPPPYGPAPYPGAPVPPPPAIDRASDASDRRQPAAAFLLSVRNSCFSPRRCASKRPQASACSSVSNTRTRGSIRVPRATSSHSSTRLARTPIGAGSRIRVSFISDD